MKVLVETENEGLTALMGKAVTIYCAKFIYCGILVGVNDTCLKLDPAKIVYNTGDFEDPDWAVASKLPEAWYIQLSSIESFGVLKDF